MKKLSLEDFTKYKYLSNINISPDGKRLGYLGHKVDLKNNSYISTLHIMDTIYGKTSTFPLSCGYKDFLWKDDTTILAIGPSSAKDRGQKENTEPLTSFYEISLNKRKASCLFKLPLQVDSFKILDDDRLLIRGLYCPRGENYNPLMATDVASEGLYKEKDYRVFNEIPFWSDQVGFSNKIRNRLYLYSISKNQLFGISDEFTNVLDYKVNEDQSKLVLITNSYTDKAYANTELEIYDLDEERILKISPFKDFKYLYANFFKDRILFIGSNMKKYGLQENPHFYITDYEGYNPMQISKDSFDFGITNSIASDSRYKDLAAIRKEGEYLYFVTTEGDSSFVNRIDMEGNMEKLTTKKGSIDDLDVFRGKVFFIGLRSLKLQEIYSLDEKIETQITYYNDWVIRERSLSIPEKLTFKTENETLIEGWVIKPVDFRLGKTYPAILYINDGPKAAYGEVFFHEMQYLANQGYVVFFCNPRGSDGRGNKFADLRGKYGLIDYQDILDFTDAVLEKYHFIDKRNLGVTGRSYGGFMVNWIIGHTSKFKAAVSQDGICNWISSFLTANDNYYFLHDQIGGTPWEATERLWNHSPLKYADQVTTPTLFIHSKGDSEAYLSESSQMYVALKYHGVESRLYILNDGICKIGNLDKPKCKINRLKIIISWFDKLLK